MTHNLIDFRGGYFTDTPNQLLKDNELHKAENCQWRGELTKRNGVSKYSSTDWSGFSACRGFIRVRINGNWYTIVALDTGAEVNFYRALATAYTAIDNDFDWGRADVEFAELNGYVIAVNGVDKPAVIYYDGGFVIKDLEEFDTRTRDNHTWWAGQWTDIGSVWTDDTEDAQDADADDFEIDSGVNDDGCWISCTQTFTKVIFASATQAAGAPVTTYQYWDGDSWEDLTLETTPVWTAAAGDRTLEFAIPLDGDGKLLWSPYGEETDVHLAGKYIVRIAHTTAAGGVVSCDSLSVYHTHYLTQIMEDERPSQVAVHGSQAYLAAGNSVNFSPWGGITGWRAGEVEYFADGGTAVRKMISHTGYLAVFKANTIYSLSGNVLDGYVKSRPLASVGTVSGRSVAMVGNLLFFVADEGIYAFDGTNALKVSKHIQTDFDLLNITSAAGVKYQNEYWVSFPHVQGLVADSVTLTCDPDTIRRDDAGDTVVSFYKFLDYKADQFFHFNGDGDSGYLMAIVDKASPFIARCDVLDYDVQPTAANITFKARTKYVFGRNPLTDKAFDRVKVKLGEVSTEGGRKHTIRLYGEDGATSGSVTAKPPTGTGYHVTDLSIPYELDGKAFGVEVEHSKVTKCVLAGVSIASKDRRF